MLDITSLRETIDSFAKENDLEIILHIPHSSLDVPLSFWKDVTISKEYFAAINLKMSDLLLLDLFKDWPYQKIIAPYSRLYVDVEKYWDEEKEIMSKYGMGAIYKKDIYGNPLHKITPEFLLEGKAYYDNHHKKLSEICSSSKKDVLLLDIHSFNKEMASIASKETIFPDICIGVNDDSSRNEDLLKRVISTIEDNDMGTYMINKPYSGTILPNERRKNQKIYSLMFEFNKGWYL